MRILVVGAGATGGYFGGRLAEAGRDVTFLVRPARAQQLRAGGLEIRSPHGDVTLQPQAVTADGLSAPFDVVLLTVKAYALESALDDLAPAVGPETTIVPVLNGMRHIDVLTARFGEGPVVGGVCIVAATLDDRGTVVQLTDLQELTYGERDGAGSERIARVDTALRGAGFGAHVSQTILQQMWEKWVQLATIGALTTSMRGNVGEIEAVPGGADLARQFLAECAGIAGACGYPPGATLLANLTAAVTAPGSNLASSMYRDLQAGRDVEVEHLLADLLARGTAVGSAAPLLAAAVTNLRVYQRRRKS